MSSIDHSFPHPMKWARHRTVRFVVYSTIAFVALFTVLAVKAQILPTPSWTHPFIQATGSAQIAGKPPLSRAKISRDAPLSR